MEIQFAAFIPAVFAIIKAAEMFGLKRSIAHFCAIPLGILVSFLSIQDHNIIENIVFGLLIGFGAIGTSDTVCCGKDAIKCRIVKGADKSARKQR
jgi:hypothetical protein